MDPVKLQAVREVLAEVSPAAFAGVSDPTRWPELEINPSRTVQHIRAAVSPDCTYRLVRAAMRAAHERICFYIYNASAPHLLKLLSQARARGVQIRIMYDATDTRDDERQKLQELGVELKVAPSSNGRKVFTVCHQKYAVIDGAILLLGSANWATTSIPLAASRGQFIKGNREWIVRIDDVVLAEWFEGLFDADWEIPELEMPAGFVEAPLLVPEALMVPSLLANLPDKVFDIKTVNLTVPVTVTPIVSPDNYFTLVRDLILDARTSVDIEQQYILAGGPKTEGLLAALEQRKGEIEIRAIVSPAFRKVGAKDNWELSVDSLDAFNLKDCLRAMNLKYFTHLHNKGVLVDRQIAIVSSTNWSENSITRAREAGVVIESPDIAEYYAQVFDFDWSIAWDAADVLPNLAMLRDDALSVLDGFQEVHPADLV